MRRAAIDIGSNSIRLAVSDGTSDSVITKLADGIESTGRLSHDGTDATLKTLSRYAKSVSGCDRVDVFATEAVRRAADGAEFCARVLRETGLTVRILSGEEEARLALAGAIKPSGAVTVCDLGGGSMELISSADGVNPDYVKSLPLGVVVLKNKYRGDFSRAVREAPQLVSEYGTLPSRPLVVIGGSACAIAVALENMTVYDKSKVDGYTVTLNDLYGITPMLMSKNLPIFRPLCKKRADTLPYGAVILTALMLYLKTDRFTVSDSGNLKAVLDGHLDDRL